MYYNQDLKAELLKIKPKKLFKPDAVSSVNLQSLKNIDPNQVNVSSHSSMQNDRKNCREGREGCCRYH